MIAASISSTRSNGDAIVHVFVTGATGWVGAAVVKELIGHGHHVVGLSRSVEKAKALQAGGAVVLHGALEDLDLLRSAAEAADAVAHLAFNHDFSRYVENAEQDRQVITALGQALKGTDKPLLVTSTLSSLRAFGRIATEVDLPPSDPAYPRRSEEAVRAIGDVRAATVRLPSSVHGVGEAHGFIPMLIDIARAKGVSAYVGDGANRWPAVHVSDAARLYRLALETGAALPAYHAVGEGGIAFREIAEVIGRKLGLPVESRDADHFGWFASFASEDAPASSQTTRARLNWEPAGPGLIADIARPEYYPGA
jgi:nucleoside-diphosphate-sugar epimerase